MIFLSKLKGLVWGGFMRNRELTPAFFCKKSRSERGSLNKYILNNKTNEENREAKASEFIEYYRIPDIKELFRELRKRQTKSEDLFWQALWN